MLSVSINIANLLSSIIKSTPLLALSHHSAPIHISNHVLIQQHITNSPIRFPWQRANHNIRNITCNNTYKNVFIIVNSLTAFHLQIPRTPYMEATQVRNHISHAVNYIHYLYYISTFTLIRRYSLIIFTQLSHPTLELLNVKS